MLHKCCKNSIIVFYEGGVSMNESWRGKLIGLGLGWFVTGPIGAVLGGILGNLYDGKEEDFSDEKLNQGEEQAIYHAYLVSLFVYIAKADGNLSSIEVKIIRNFFKKKGSTEQEMLQIKEALKIASRLKSIKVDEIITQVNQIFDYDTKLDILELCYYIAASDKIISSQEATRLTKLGNLMHINITRQYELEMKYGFESINQQEKNQRIDEDLEDLKREMRGEKRKYSTNNSSNSSSKNKSYKNSYKKTSSNTYKQKRKTPWEILEVKEGATRKEIKKAYIKMQRKYHPDINPSEKAEEIIKEVNIAYDTLSKSFK